MEKLIQTDDLVQRPREGETILAKRHIIAIALFGIVALSFFIGTYINHPNHYPVGHPMSWWGWWDQGRYIASTRAIRAGDLTPTEHLYPIGYPALGAIFYDLMPNDPFVIPNLVCFGAICSAFILICRRIVTLTEALVLCFAGVVWQAAVRDNLVIAWSTTPRDCALYVLAWLALFRSADPLYPVFSGICVAGIYAMRPGDILLALPLLVAPFVGAVRASRVPQFVSRFVLFAAPIVAAVHGFNYLVYGAVFPEAYSVAVKSIGFNVSFIPTKALSMFIDPQLLYGERDSLIASFPYLLLTLPGAVVFIKRLGAAGWGIVAAQVVTVLYYLAYNDWVPANVFRFLLIHYIAWILPFCLFYAYLSVRIAWREFGILPTALLLSLSAMLFLLPKITVAAVTATDGGSPPILSSDPRAITFNAPKDSFDTIVLTHMHSDDFVLGLDNLQVRLRKDYQVAVPESGIGVVVLFYSPQHASSVRVKVGSDAADAGMATTAFYFNRHWSLTLRNPRTYLAKLPPSMRFTSAVSDHSAETAVTPLPPCTQPPLQIERAEMTKGIVRRSAFPNLGSDGSPNLNFHLVAVVPFDVVIYRVSADYSAGGHWISTSLPAKYPTSPGLWGAVVKGPEANHDAGLYHLNGSCGIEQFSVVLPLPADSVDGNFNFRLDTSRGPLAVTSVHLRLPAAP